jgi:hypothetical protein
MSCAPLRWLEAGTVLNAHVGAQQQPFVEEAWVLTATSTRPAVMLSPGR